MQAPCAVEMDLRARDAGEARLEREEARVAEVLKGVRASVLAGLLTGDRTAAVKGWVWRTDRLGAVTVDETIGDVIGYDDITDLLCKVIATDTPEAAAFREAVANRVVKQLDGYEL